MRRAVKVSLKFITRKKKESLHAFLTSYRSSVNFFIASLWEKKGKLDSETLNRLPDAETELSYLQKGHALRQALSIVFSVKKLAGIRKSKASFPTFSGMVCLSRGLCLIQEGQKSFDLIVRITSLHKKQRIIIPTRKTSVFNKWMSSTGAKLVQGCAISENKLIIWISLPDFPLKETGSILGIDLGVNKLITTNTGEFFGLNFKQLRDKINQKKPRSKAKKRALVERDHYINKTVKSLPWDSIKVLGHEDLTGIKKGKGKRGKRFRKAMVPWTPRMIMNRIEQRAEENRVLLVPVSPTNTSRTCPSCSLVSEKNRIGEKFRCVACDYKADSDHVGAMNVLARTNLFLGSLKSPRPENPAE